MTLQNSIPVLVCSLFKLPFPLYTRVPSIALQPKAYLHHVSVSTFTFLFSNCVSLGKCYPVHVCGIHKSENYLQGTHCFCVEARSWKHSELCYHKHENWIPPLLCSILSLQEAVMAQKHISAASIWQPPCQHVFKPLSLYLWCSQLCTVFEFMWQSVHVTHRYMLQGFFRKYFITNIV